MKIKVCIYTEVDREFISCIKNVTLLSLVDQPKPISEKDTDRK